MSEEFIKDVMDVTVLDSMDLSIHAERERRDFRKYWDADFINRVLSSIECGRHRMLCKFLWMSGLRISEALNLKKSGIDFSNLVMDVPWLKSRKYMRMIVPIHHLLCELLKVYTATLNLDDRVFPWTRQNGYCIVKKYFGGSPHQFRHSFAVNWLRQDGDIVSLHRILGHSNIQTTMEYLKIVPIDQGKELLKMRF